MVTAILLTNLNSDEIRGDNAICESSWSQSTVNRCWSSCKRSSSGPSRAWCGLMESTAAFLQLVSDASSPSNGVADIMFDFMAMSASSVLFGWACFGRVAIFPCLVSASTSFCQSDWLFRGKLWPPAVDSSKGTITSLNFLRWNMLDVVRLNDYTWLHNPFTWKPSCCSESIQSR